MQGASLETQFEDLPYEIRTQILSGTPSLLRKSTQLSKEYRDLLGRDYDREFCLQPIQPNEIIKYVSERNSFGYIDLGLKHFNTVNSIRIYFDGGAFIRETYKFKINPYMYMGKISRPGINFANFTRNMPESYSNGTTIFDFVTIYNVLRRRGSCDQDLYARNLVLNELDRLYATLDPDIFLVYIHINSLRLGLPTDNLVVSNIPILYQQIRDAILSSY